MERGEYFPVLLENILSVLAKHWVNKQCIHITLPSHHHLRSCKMNSFERGNDTFRISQGEKEKKIIKKKRYEIIINK